LQQSILKSQDPYYSKGKNSTSVINKAIAQDKARLQVERDLKRAQNQLASAPDYKKQDYQKLVNLYQSRLDSMPAAKYEQKDGEWTINDQKVTEEEMNQYLEKRTQLYSAHATQLQKIEASQRRQVGFVQQIANGFKQSFRNLIDFSAAYKVIGEVRQIFQ